MFPDIDLELEAIYRGDDEYSCFVLVDEFVEIESSEMKDGMTDRLPCWSMPGKEGLHRCDEEEEP